MRKQARVITNNIPLIKQWNELKKEYEIVPITDITENLRWKLAGRNVSKSRTVLAEFEKLIK